MPNINKTLTMLKIQFKEHLIFLRLLQTRSEITNDILQTLTIPIPPQFFSKNPQIHFRFIKEIRSLESELKNHNVNTNELHILADEADQEGVKLYPVIKVLQSCFSPLRNFF